MRIEKASLKCRRAIPNTSRSIDQVAHDSLLNLSILIIFSFKGRYSTLCKTQAPEALRNKTMKASVGEQDAVEQPFQHLNLMRSREPCEIRPGPSILSRIFFWSAELLVQIFTINAGDSQASSSGCEGGQDDGSRCGGTIQQVLSTHAK